MNGHHRRPADAGPVRLEITPDDAGWEHLSFSVVELAAGEQHRSLLDDQETAVVPLRGRARITAGEHTSTLARSSVFTEMPHVLYVPPGIGVEIAAEEDGFVFAIGSAPADASLPVRLFAPDEMTTEIRGGGTARRQVNHILAPPLPARRLILYEVYVPRGTWSGWAPHCHDGRDGSPYLEETYYFRLDPPEGFAIHRNWRQEEDFDETFAAGDGDVVLVTKGYHSSVACPSSHLYFLNYLAGELVGDERRTPPCFHADYTWIQDDWNAGAWTLPITGP